MVANLNSLGMIPGQDNGKSINKKVTQIQNLELITLIQDAIGQGVATKQGKFSDVLGSLKQPQLQSSPTSNQKYPQEIKEATSTQPPAKNTFDYSSTRKKETPKEPPCFKEYNSAEKPKITNSEIIIVKISQNNDTHISDKNIKNGLNEAPQPTLNTTNALEYDLLTISNSQVKDIPLESIALGAIFTNTSIQKNDPQDLNLKSQINQWVNEGKVQIQKLNTPLEIDRPLVIKPQNLNIEEKIDLTLKPDLLRNPIPENTLKPEPLENQVLETPSKADMKPEEIETSKRTSTQRSQSIQEAIVTRQQKEITSVTIKPTPADEPTALARNPIDNSKGTRPVYTQPIQAAPASQLIDNPMNKTLLQRTTSLEEGEIGKTGVGQNRIPQSSSEKITGKMPTAAKTVTMTEKIQALQQIKSQIKATLQKGETHLLVKLTPDDLGKVDIKLDISKDGTVSAFFKTENRETMLLLSKYADDLRQIFGDSGLTSDMSGMNFSSSDQQFSQFDQAAKSIGKNIPFMNEQEEIMSPSIIATPGLSSNQRLNITV